MMSKEIGRGMNTAEDVVQRLYDKAPGATPFVFDVGNSMENTVVIGTTGAGMSTYETFRLTETEIAKVCGRG